MGEGKMKIVGISPPFLTESFLSAEPSCPSPRSWDPNWGAAKGGKREETSVLLAPKHPPAPVLGLAGNVSVCEVWVLGKARWPQLLLSTQVPKIPLLGAEQSAPEWCLHLPWEEDEGCFSPAAGR